MLMTYRGAKTGKVRKAPLVRVKHEGRYAAVASKGGWPTNPQCQAAQREPPRFEGIDTSSAPRRGWFVSTYPTAATEFQRASG
ncbi:hypothetical protein GCM10022225_77570 [Plantactinospora mayteni]|uniref:DUF397 domain-containing protein n=1 Tax=Plantactinospora mayteni TaxID=566021 RepID=A0ABQ4F2Q6_9ACTN|nr:hypothetical protein Pma05_77630 [Plantactinospora mayteni]